MKKKTENETNRNNPKNISLNTFHYFFYDMAEKQQWLYVNWTFQRLNQVRPNEQHFEVEQQHLSNTQLLYELAS